MSDAFHERPQDITFLRAGGYVGQRIPGTSGYIEREAINASGTLAHMIDLTISSYGGSETYEFTVTRDGHSYDFSHTVTAGADTAAEVIDELVAAINETSGGVLDYAYPTDRTTTLRLTAWDSGAASTFTLSDLSSNLSQATTQTGADASTITFGRGVLRASAPSPGGVFSARQPTMPLDSFMALPTTTTLAPRVDTFVVAGSYSSGDIFQCSGTIVWGDTVIPVALPFGIGQTTVDAAWADLVTALNANFGSYITAAYTSGSNTLTITSDYAGMQMDFYIPAPGSNTVTKTSTNTDKIASELFLGACARRAIAGTTELGTYNTAIPANDTGVYVARGAIWMDYVGTAPTAGARVYLCAGSSESGKFSAAAGTNRIPLPFSMARWGAANSEHGIAPLYLGAA